jgi:hypothetical protein
LTGVARSRREEREGEPTLERERGAGGRGRRGEEEEEIANGRTLNKRGRKREEK